MFQSAFQEFAAILVLAAAAGVIAVRLRQPLIIAYIVVGVVSGPAGLGWVTASNQIELLASMGIAILLFVVGLNLDVGLIKSVGPVALATGIGQIVFTSAIGFLIAIALGFAPVPALYIAVALTFSSTIIIVKLLSDKREIDSLHGRIAIGFLIVQDIFVVLTMIVLSGLSDAEAGIATQVLRLVVVSSAFVAGTVVLMRWVMPRLLRGLAHSQEMLTLFAVAWAIALAALGDGVGFSKEVGAFLGGVSIASTPYRESIAARLAGLRDFLLLFFFIELGARLDVSTLGHQAGPAAVFSIFVLVGNPLVVVAIMGYMGYRRRTGLLAGLTVSQISEFSLILAALGLSLGHIDRGVLSLITLVGIITISVSTYMILGSERLYAALSGPLRVFERPVPFRESAAGFDEPGDVDVIIMGLGRFGGQIASDLCDRGLHVFGVDFDPEALDRARRAGVAVRYGDVEDPDQVASLPLDRAAVVASTLPSLRTNALIAQRLRDAGFSGRFVATAHGAGDARRLTELGAAATLLPFSDAASAAADIIHDAVRTPSAASA